MAVLTLNVVSGAHVVLEIDTHRRVIAEEVLMCTTFDQFASFLHICFRLVHFLVLISVFHSRAAVLWTVVEEVLTVSYRAAVNAPVPVTLDRVWFKQVKWVLNEELRHEVSMG